MAPGANNNTFAFVILTAMPLFFSSNLIFGRAAVENVEPWTLACLRWSLASLVLLPFVWGGLHRHRHTLLAQWKLIAVLGLLGMWICGALVYFALRYTTATNGTLIYTSSPVLIVLFEWLFRGRKISAREMIGIPLAFLGVLTIIVKGSLGTLFSLSFNAGDIIFAVTALSWAVYSVLLKKRALAEVPPIVMFTAIAIAGALTLFPYMIWESIAVGVFPTSANSWMSIAGIVVFSSVLAFSCFQYGVHAVGPSIAGLFLYLLPVYGVGMAVIFLGESVEIFHFAGFLLVMAGIMLVTFPVNVLRDAIPGLRLRPRGRVHPSGAE